MNETVSITLDTGLSFTDLVRVARGARLVLAPAAWQRVRDARAVIERALALRIPTYGLNTGLGSLKKYIIEDERINEFNADIVRAHAVSVSERRLCTQEVRAVIAARVSGLVQGGSGVRTELVELLIALLNHGVHPVVYAENASMGEGDLSQLAQIGLVVMGEGRAEISGEELSGSEALSRAGLEPLALGAKEGLGLISSSACTIGLGALALSDALELLDGFDISAALSLEGYAANLGTLDAAAITARPLPGQHTRGKHLRALLTGSALWASPRTLQDPLSFRCVAQVHGACEDALRYAISQLEAMLAARTDSPMVVTGEDYLVVSGNFDATSLALAFDTTRLALHRVMVMSSQRSNKLLWSDFTGLPTALAEERNARRGMTFNTISRALATLVAKAYSYCTPSSLSYTPQVTEGSDDYASMAPLALQQLGKLMRAMRSALAIELLYAAHAIELRSMLSVSSTASNDSRLKLSPALQRVFEWIMDRAHIFDDHARLSEFFAGIDLESLLDLTRDAVSSEAVRSAFAPVAKGTLGMRFESGLEDTEHAEPDNAVLEGLEPNVLS
jgi:histidine ammonia-lyase